ncbi:hypothetical protein HD553DRAFT_337972 [Filobasidium floriforme]|uniref:uncharacterized protein n=1 Tax=Filobasidium floriforme TaxID=5210 RepID=UPI001E8DFBE6|nr:uncharacterized protein HD553DRAFT_337972 [Filobasidium floriforme]KAH8090285.1 hypothetical protein HD553DRAFT_337972 [Filobasidium floriforme]
MPFEAVPPKMQRRQLIGEYYGGLPMASFWPTMVKTNINVSNLSIKILHWITSSLAYHQTLNAMVFFSTIKQIDDPNDKFDIIAGLKISNFDMDENLKRKIEVIAGCPNLAAVAAVVASAKHELEELLLPDAALESISFSSLPTEFQEFYSLLSSELAVFDGKKHLDLAPHVLKMYETWRPYPDHDKRIVTIIKGSDVVVEDSEKAQELIATNRRHILLKTTLATVSAEEISTRRSEFDQVFPSSVYWKILHEQQTVTPFEMREDVLRAIWASLANRMPVAVGLFDVLVALHREVPAPLSATVDHVAASPNLMIMVHIIQRLDRNMSPYLRQHEGHPKNKDGKNYLSNVVPTMKIWRIMYAELHRYAMINGVPGGDEAMEETLEIANVEKSIDDEYERQAKAWGR